MRRPYVSYLKQKYGSDGFFLTDFFRGKAVAIVRDCLSNRTVERMRKEFCVIPQGEYYYITEKLKDER